MNSETESSLAAEAALQLWTMVACHLPFLGIAFSKPSTVTQDFVCWVLLHKSHMKQTALADNPLLCMLWIEAAPIQNRLWIQANQISIGDAHNGKVNNLEVDLSIETIRRIMEVCLKGSYFVSPWSLLFPWQNCLLKHQPLISSAQLSGKITQKSDWECICCEVFTISIAIFWPSILVSSGFWRVLLSMSVCDRIMLERTNTWRSPFDLQSH